MTSANVVEFRIEDLKGNQVGKHYQSILCKTHWEDLLKFKPLDNHLIIAFGYDEEEEYWENKPINLKEFLIKNRIKIND